MTDVTHTNDTAVTSFEYNLKCRNFYDIEFSQKATTRLCFPLFFKNFIIPYFFFFFCSLFFFSARRCARNCVLAYRELRTWSTEKICHQITQGIVLLIE